VHTLILSAHTDIERTENAFCSQPVLTVRLQVKGLEEAAERAAEAQRLATAAVRGEAEEAQVRRHPGTRNQFEFVQL